MSASQRNWPMISLLVLMGAVVGFAILTQALHLRVPFGVRLPLSLLVAVPTSWLMIVYWRRIDELARDAQKTAWFWGGSIGLSLAIIALSVIARVGFAAVGLPAAISAPNALVLGGVIAASGQIVGFLIAWAIWWWTKR